jgi:hypothetical protein
VQIETVHKVPSRRNEKTWQSLKTVWEILNLKNKKKKKKPISTEIKLLKEADYHEMFYVQNLN